MTTHFNIDTTPYDGNRVLHGLGRTWFVVVAVGQIAFILFILAYYGTRTLGGDWASWNDKSLITGHVEGDGLGNILFATHVLLAAIVTVTGLLQLMPQLRAKHPAAHRLSGRIFLIQAAYLAVGGLWLTWIRGSYLSIPSALGVSLNGVLILIFSALAIRHALRRDIARHQIWAMRTFMVVSGVWFFRVGLMGWVIVNQEPRGMTATLSGPADIALSFGSYLIPLLGLEIYRHALRHSSRGVKAVSAIVVGSLTLFMAIGIFGAITVMWFPA